MGIGKYLHRKKGDTPSPQQPDRQSRVTSQGNADTSLGTSRYEATAAGSTPETGSYPIRGNNSSAAVTSRRGSVSNSMDRRGNQPTRPETASSHPVRSVAPRLDTPPYANNSDYHLFNQPQNNTQTRTHTTTTTTTTRSPPMSRQLEADSGLAQDFSGLNMSNDTARGKPTSSPASYYPSSGSRTIDPRVDSPPRNDPGTRAVNQPASQQQYQLPSNYQRSGAGYYDNDSRSPTNAQGSPIRPRDQNNNSPMVNSVPPRGSSSHYTDTDDSDIRRRDSIPRKQVGSSLHTPSTSVTSASASVPGAFPEAGDQQAPPVPQHDRPLSQQPRYHAPSASRQQYDASPQQAYDSAPSPQQAKYQEPKMETQNPYYGSQQTTFQPPATRQDTYQRSVEPAKQFSYPNQTGSSTRNGEYPNHGVRAAKDRRQNDYVAPLAVRPKETTSSNARDLGGNEIVERAKTNTYDTEVIEKIAPAVVHETVQQKTHHVREEVITRDIHTHDVFHRILPVIDVEVLPPRHFLPVEGGGLVEIGADEVPGRGNNWVIAETASKIPSDQPAPKGPRRFTARQFPGTEGDATRYTTPDGYEHTESTWIHPPELETGGRDTGQTWPMVFGKGSPSDGKIRTQGHSSAKHAKHRSKMSSGDGRMTGTGHRPQQQSTSTA